MQIGKLLSLLDFKNLNTSSKWGQLIIADKVSLVVTSGVCARIISALEVNSAVNNNQETMTNMLFVYSKSKKISFFYVASPFEPTCATPQQYLRETL